jgi:hypothetical protein
MNTPAPLKRGRELHARSPDLMSACASSGEGMLLVMAGLDPAIHAFVWHQRKTWMPATSAGMTVKLARVVFGDRQSERSQMKKPTVKYSKGKIGRVRIVEDFLPPLEKLVLREDNVKVTLSLSQRSVAFFKRAARQRRVPYQRMMRALVDAYAEKQEGKG